MNDTRMQVEKEQEEQTKKFSPLGVGLSLALACAAFLSGLQMGSGDSNQQASLADIFFRSPEVSEEVDLDEFWLVWNLLEEKYVAASSTEFISKEQRIEGAIQGLVSAYGDPYTVFLPPKESEQFQEDISGNFSGVGMEVGIRENMVAVIAPLPDTPAERAGLVAGDIVMRIDGTSTEGMSIDEAVERIRGEKGSEVVLTIYREGRTELTEMKIIRDTISVPTVRTRTEGDVFVIELYSFNALAESGVQNALREYVESGADKMVLDLRSNPGGYLQSAVSIASYFLPAGKVVVREGFGEGEDEQIYRSYGKMLGSYAPKKMVVLINQGSASASEILAGALQEHGAATLIGTQTFGKGSVQELVELGTGSSLKVTIARWFTPEGRSISENGLAPDIEVPIVYDELEPGEDPQFEAALEYLHS